ncbi:MAG TPA: hypothetical protein ENK18_13540 [Deltaproteobacteria bacterium]|nr:hypothetical protein [Deltaproteobacteria bacterium]
MIAWSLRHVREPLLAIAHLLAIGLWLSGCTHRPMSTPADGLSFAFGARPTRGEVRVVPALAVHAPLEVNLDSYLGASLPHQRELVRHARTRALAEIPRAMGLALPGEVNSELGLTWGGQFRSHRLPFVAQQRLADALVGRRPDLHAVLAEAAAAVGGEATLFSWVTDLRGDPLTLRGLPGETVETTAGPVVLDHRDEPFLVTARIGMALVTRDGEVVLRYEDTYDAILSEDGGADETGRVLARSLVQEIVLVWATDPRLWAGEPSPPDAPRQRRGALSLR